MSTLGPTVIDLQPGDTTYRIVAPKKIALGKSVSGNKNPGLFKVYVPTRDGGELTLSTTAGTIEVFAPDGQPAKDATGKPVPKAKDVKFEVPFDVFGWYGVVVRGAPSYNVSAKFKITGRAYDADGTTPIVPWHFYYFAFTKVQQWGANHPASKYQNRFGGTAYDWEKTSFWQSEKTHGRDGLDGHGITDAACAEKNARSGTNYTVANCGWWGHCDAAATAAALWKKVPTGTGFEPIDIQWMLTEIAMRHFDLRCEFHLGGEGTPNPRAHPSNQEQASPSENQACDKDAARFHAAICRVIKRRKEPALMDFRALKEWGGPDEVWNQLVYKFEATVEQAEDDRPGGDELATAKRVKIKNTLTANADNEGLARQNGDPESDGAGWIRECHYTISFDGSGNADLNHPRNNYEYVGWGAKSGFPPRYIFALKGLNLGYAQGGNPHVKLDHVKTLGVQMYKRYGG